MLKSEAVRGTVADGIDRRSRMRRAGRIASTGIVAALAAGCCTGVLARILMRLVALAAGETPHFSWAGSLGIVIIFAIAALPGALLAAAISGRLRWVVPAIGAALLCVPATGVASAELGSTHGYSLTRWIAVGTAGTGVYACIAALPIITLRLVNHIAHAP